VLTRHSIKLNLLEAGLDNAVGAKLETAGVFDNCISYAAQYAHPEKIDVQGSLRDMAETLAQQLTETHQTAGSIVILSYPDVEEGDDRDHSTAVSVYVDGQHKTRTYGFGGRSNLVRDWVSRWGMSAAWRMLTDEFDTEQD
jgi:hypothetical protein